MRTLGGNVFTESLSSNGYTHHDTNAKGTDVRETKLAGLLSSAVHLLAPVFNISFLRIDGQVAPK
jgi:hypothetical protein